MTLTHLKLQLPEKKFQKLFPLIRDEITKPWSEHTLDSLYLLNALENKYSNIINENFLQENFGIRSLISDESFEKLSNILLVSRLLHYNQF